MFHKDVVKDENFKKQFLTIAESIDADKGWENLARRPFVKSDITSTYVKSWEQKDTVFLPFKQYIANQYGEGASTVMLRGLAKAFSADAITWEGTRQYQKGLYADYLAES